MVRVIISYAQSLDGRIATKLGDSRWISGPESLVLAHELRRDCDAILVGIGTVLRDDPQLSCRHPAGCPSQPLRIILDSQLRLPVTAQVLRELHRQPTVVFYAGQNPLAPAISDRLTAIQTSGATTWPCSLAVNGQLSVPDILAGCEHLGIRKLYVEGGSQVITSFIKANAFDELWVVCAPMIIGTGTAAVGDLATEVIAQAKKLVPFEVKQLGHDLIWKLRPA
jgi:5-amino-6-(5-phosphoribosylamino)uracil reductase